VNNISTFFVRGIVAAITFLICTLLVGNAVIGLKQPAAITALFPLIGICASILYSNLNDCVTTGGFVYRTIFSGIVTIFSYLILCHASVSLNVPEILWATLFPLVITLLLMESRNEE